MKSEDNHYNPITRKGEVFAMKVNRKAKLIAATMFASMILTGVFAGQAQAQAVRFGVEPGRHLVVQRPVYVRQVVIVRRPRVYTYQYPRYRYVYRYRYPRYRYYGRWYGYHYHHHRNGVRVWIR